MKQISLFILLAINSYGQSHSKIVDTIVTKSVFIKTIELQNKKFDTKIHDLTNEFDNKESKIKRQIRLVNTLYFPPRLALIDLCCPPTLPPTLILTSTLTRCL